MNSKVCFDGISKNKQRLFAILTCNGSVDGNSRNCGKACRIQFLKIPYLACKFYHYMEMERPYTDIGFYTRSAYFGNCKRTKRHILRLDYLSRINYFTTLLFNKEVVVFISIFMQCQKINQLFSEHFDGEIMGVIPCRKTF